MLVGLGRISYGLYCSTGRSSCCCRRTGRAGPVGRSSVCGSPSRWRVLAVVPPARATAAVRIGLAGQGRWGAAGATLAVTVGAIFVVPRPRRSSWMPGRSIPRSATRWRSNRCRRPTPRWRPTKAPPLRPRRRQARPRHPARRRRAPPRRRRPSRSLARAVFLVVGDSTGSVLGSGLVEWAYGHPDLVQVSVGASGACGIVRGGEYEDTTLTAALQMTCGELMWKQVPAMVAELRPDVVAVSITPRGHLAEELGRRPNVAPTDGRRVPSAPRRRLRRVLRAARRRRRRSCRVVAAAHLQLRHRRWRREGRPELRRLEPAGGRGGGDAAGDPLPRGRDDPGLRGLVHGQPPVRGQRRPAGRHPPHRRCRRRRGEGVAGPALVASARI